MSRYHQRRQWFLQNPAIAAGYNDHKDEIDHELAREAADHAARADADTSPMAVRMRKAIAQRKQFEAHG